MGPTLDPPVYLRELTSGICVPIGPQWPIHWQFYLEGIGLPGIARGIARRISGRRLPGTHPSTAADGLRWEHFRREAAKWRCYLTDPRFLNRRPSDAASRTWSTVNNCTVAESAQLVWPIHQALYVVTPIPVYAVNAA